MFPDKIILTLSRSVVRCHRGKQRLCTFPRQMIQHEKGSTEDKKKKAKSFQMGKHDVRVKVRDKSVREAGVQPVSSCCSSIVIVSTNWLWFRLV